MSYRFALPAYGVGLVSMDLGRVAWVKVLGASGGLALAGCLATGAGAAAPTRWGKTRRSWFTVRGAIQTR